MLTTQLKDLLRNLRTGKMDVSEAPSLEQLLAAEFAAELRRYYPIVFQERTIGTMHELGLARFVGLKGASRKHSSARSSVPVLLNCVLISSYGDSLSGISTISWIAVIPAASSGTKVTVIASRGYSLDKTPDGWTLRPRERSRVKFSVEFLTKRGWNFDAVRPVWPQP